MISEAELMGLSFPDAPKMVTNVPGPESRGADGRIGEV